MNDDEDFMMLNKLTGLVHEYDGHTLDRPLDCGCNLDDNDLANLIMVYRDHLERGIWEPAPCVEDK